MGARFLKVPTITSTGKVLSFTLFQDRGFKRFAEHEKTQYHLTKQNGLVCWLGTAFVFFRFWFKYLFLCRKGYRDFEKRAPVQGNFRTGPTSPRLPFVALSPSEISYRRVWYAILQLHHVNEELQLISVWNRPPSKTRTLEVHVRM